MYCLRLASILLLVCGTLGVDQTVKENARKFLQYLGEATCNNSHIGSILSFNYETNMNDENLEKLNEFYSSDDGIKYESYPWLKIGDPDMLRQARKYGLLITKEERQKSSAKLEELNDIVSSMEDAYFNQDVCMYKARSVCNFSDYKNIFQSSRDPNELKYYWTALHDKVGLAVKKKYSEYIKVSNEYARALDYSNRADMWIKEFEGPPVDKFDKAMIYLYNQIKPLYLQLHSFIRKRLFRIYGPKYINRKGPIPIHLTGSSTGQLLQPIFKWIAPYPKKPSLDVTKALVEQKYTGKKMAKICVDFHQSLGLWPMPDTFWNYSVFEKPVDREATCVPTAYDMFDNKDYRIQTCANINTVDLQVLCHEISHLEYAIGYQNNPCCYRSLEESAINEGWADVSGMSIITEKHLKRVGLLEKSKMSDPEVEINHLFFTALDKIVFLPYAMSMEFFRLKYFRGEIRDENANSAWWKLRLDYQGFAPPVPRSNDVIDAADKYHVVADYKYMDYFYAGIIQFQIHQALCIKALEFDPECPDTPLYKCDIYGSKKAGNLLKKMFALGGSIPWQDALKIVTGKREIDALPMFNYYSKLYSWLKKENKRTKEVIGW